MLTVERRYVTDILVVGGGGAACTAAVAAARNGASVIMASKGKVGNSGNTIMIGGSYGMDGESAYHEFNITQADPTFTKDELFKSIVNDGFNISDQNMVEQFVEDSPRIVHEVKQWGEEAGQFFRFYPPANWDVSGRGMGRALLEGIRKTPNIQLHQDVAIIELLKNGDKVTGALGIDLYAGTLLQFDAKATILATGGFQPYTIKNTNTDITGDGQAMAYRAGAKLADMEFLLFLMTATEPNEMRGSILPAICTFRKAFDYDPVDRYGNKIEVPEKLREMETTSEMCKLVHMFYFGKAIGEGRGTDNGGIYFDFSRFTDKQIDVMFEAVKEHFEGFYKRGYYHGESIDAYLDLAKRNRRIEVVLASEYSVGGVFVDENMSTGVAGLYAAGEVASGVFGANRVADAVTEMLVQGYKAGEAAAQHTVAETVVESSERSLQTAVGALQQLMQNRDGIRVPQAVAELERISDHTLGIIRNEQSLQKGLGEYQQLRDQLDNLTIQSKSLLYNRELLGAIQLKNQLLCCQVAAEMAKARKESRGLHLREDYTYIDNENWQVRLLAHNANGSIRLEKKVPVVTRIPLRKPEKVDYETFILEEDLGMKNMEEK